MDTLEHDVWGRHTDEEERKCKEDQCLEALCQQEEERRKKLEDDQLAEALWRSEEEWKVEADCQMAMNHIDKMQIAVDLSKDLNKVTPPTFYGRSSGEDAEAWITSMDKYFLVQKYTGKS